MPAQFSFFCRSKRSRRHKKIKDAIHQKFRVEEEPPIYDPDSFEKFCKSVGCNDLFNAIVTCQSSPRQSSERLHLNKIRSVAIKYRLCYGLSQWCNYFQKDFATYLRYSGVSLDAIDTGRNISDCCSSRGVEQDSDKDSQQHSKLLNEFIDDAVSKKCLVVAIINDHTFSLTCRRPQDEATPKTRYFTTIVIKKFPEIKTIKVSKSIHNPEGVDVPDVSSFLSEDESAKYFTTSTYATPMPQWVTTAFFQPESEKERLLANEYSQSEAAQKFLKMENLQLVDFYEHPLKSTQNFEEAMEVFAK